MKFSELIKIRQSVRQYQQRPVALELLDKLIESVRLAPSASNSQPWKLIVVDDPELCYRETGTEELGTVLDFVTLSQELGNWGRCLTLLLCQDLLRRPRESHHEIRDPDRHQVRGIGEDRYRGH